MTLREPGRGTLAFLGSFRMITALAAAAVGLLLLRQDAKPAQSPPAVRAVMPPGPGTTPPCPQAMNPGDGDPARTHRPGG
jgi:hypothetical protein